MRLLFVGDVVGKPGRRAVQRLLPGLIEERGVDWVVVNVENAAGGHGVTKAILEEFQRLPIDCFTSGNHIWDKREILPVLDRVPNLLRPANYPDGNPGTGLYVGATAAGVKVATINLQGQVYLPSIDSPFRVADRLLESLDDDVKVVLVDFHAEVTSEKQALGYHLDGRVSAVLGTHTHVPTADERILAGGTVLISDVGMTGAYDGIIGFRADKVLQKFYLQTKVSFDVAKRDPRLAGALVDVDPDTGRATAVERLLLPVE